MTRRTLALAPLLLACTDRGTLDPVDATGPGVPPAQADTAAPAPCEVRPPDASLPLVAVFHYYGVVWHPEHGAEAWGGRWQCWGDACSLEPPPTNWQLPDRPLVAASRHGMCVLTVDGERSCWRAHGDLPALPDDDLADLGRHCVLDRTGRLHCAGEGDVGYEGGVRLVDGDDFLRERPCVLDASGRATCDGTPPPPLDQRDRCWTSAASGSVLSCGIDAVGRLSCHGREDSTRDSAWVPLPWGEEAPRWQRIDVDGGMACGLTEEGRAHCWGLGPELGSPWPVPEDVPVAQPPDRADLVALDVTSDAGGKGAACGFTEDGELLCWGEVSSSNQLLLDHPWFAP